MNKLTIPTILVATVMVAGIFAFMPVEQASTVHTTGTLTLAADSITAAVIQNSAIDAATFVAGSISEAAVLDNVEPFALSVTTTSLDLSAGGAATCTSTAPFVLEISTQGATGTTLTINDGVNNFVFNFLTGALNQHHTLAGEGGQIWTLTGSAATVRAIMTIHTQADATAECAP